MVKSNYMFFTVYTIKIINFMSIGARCKIARSGYKSPYDHLTSCNNNNNHYRFSKTVSESSNSNSVAQYRNGNNFNRNRYVAVIGTQIIYLTFYLYV